MEKTRLAEDAGTRNEKDTCIKSEETKRLNDIPGLNERLPWTLQAMKNTNTIKPKSYRPSSRSRKRKQFAVTTLKCRY